MSETSIDDRGRVYLPKEVRDRYGDRFRIVQLDSGIKLIPLHDDPIDGLRDALEGLRDVRAEEIEDLTERRGREEALDGVR